LQLNYYEIPLAYNINQPTKYKAWDSKAYPIFIFESMEFFEIDDKNMFTSLLHIADYIKSRKVKKGLINDIPELKGFGEVV